MVKSTSLFERKAAETSDDPHACMRQSDPPQAPAEAQESRPEEERPQESRPPIEMQANFGSVTYSARPNISNP